MINLILILLSTIIMMEHIIMIIILVIITINAIKNSKDIILTYMIHYLKNVIIHAKHVIRKEIM